MQPLTQVGEEADERITIQEVAHTDTRFASLSITPLALKYAGVRWYTYACIVLPGCRPIHVMRGE
jgi:hypothetical protein